MLEVNLKFFGVLKELNKHSAVMLGLILPGIDGVINMVSLLRLPALLERKASGSRKRCMQKCFREDARFLKRKSFTK